MPKDSILCARYSTNHPWRLTPDHPTSYDTQLSEVQTSPFRFKLGHSHGRYFIKNSWSMNKWTNAFPLMLQVQHTSQWNLLPAWSCYYLYLVIHSGIETSGLCCHLLLGSFTLSSVQFSCSVVSSSLQPHESQHARPPCPSPTPGVHSNSCPLSWWCHPTISSSVVPFSSCPQSFPASWSFPMTQLFTSGGQSIGVSALASVLNVY